MAAALDRSIVEDLEDLRKNWQSIKDLPDNVQQGLYRSGLLDIDVKEHILESFVVTSVTYKLNNLGEKLVEYALADNS